MTTDAKTTTYSVCGQGPTFTTNSKLAAVRCARRIPLGYVVERPIAHAAQLPRFQWGLLLVTLWKLRRLYADNQWPEIERVI